MRKFTRRILLCAILAAAVWCGSVLGDRQTLDQELIRLHVVAASDSREDRAIKLRVRDAVTESLQSDLARLRDAEEAKAYLEANLPKIRQIANQTLQAAGCDAEAMVSLCREVFDTRQYDTFTLPAGVYEALRIVIGDGQGQNWWCVVFPQLCLEVTGEGFRAEAAGAGFSGRLTDTLTGEGYEIRFFFLDQLGKIRGRLRGA